ncbi:MAG: nitrilase-related carbon-nitrogen hydrolase, partial [Anaerolineae bacterium]
MQIRVAGAQIPITRDVAQNVQAIGRAIAYAAHEKADVLLTPEGSLSGYTPAFDRAAVEEGLRVVTRGARQAGIGLALGTCAVEADGACYNQLRFYLPDGTYLG